jgi:hypothetical protein
LAEEDFRNILRDPVTGLAAEDDEEEEEEAKAKA